MSENTSGTWPEYILGHCLLSTVETTFLHPALIFIGNEVLLMVAIIRMIVEKVLPAMHRSLNPLYPRRKKTSSWLAGWLAG